MGSTEDRGLAVQPIGTEALCFRDGKVILGWTVFVRPVGAHFEKINTG